MPAAAARAGDTILATNSALRPLHASQGAFKRANRQLKRLRTMLGAVIRDIARKIAGQPGLMQVFGLSLSLARRVRDQRERGRKVYSLHAPEVECIGKGKAHKPYEFGVKVSVATPLKRSHGGQFVAHVKALPGNPYDGHTLATILPAIESSTGANLGKIVADAGYRGHNAPKDKTFKVHVAGYKRGLTKAVKRALRRRSRHRAGHRPSQDRSPHGPQLPGLRPRRRQQRRARRRRLQFQLPAQLTEAFVRLHPGGARNHSNATPPAANSLTPQLSWYSPLQRCALVQLMLRSRVLQGRRISAWPPRCRAPPRRLPSASARAHQARSACQRVIVLALIGASRGKNSKRQKYCQYALSTHRSTTSSSDRS